MCADTRCRRGRGRALSQGQPKEPEVIGEDGLDEAPFQRLSSSAGALSYAIIRWLAPPTVGAFSRRRMTDGSDATAPDATPAIRACPDRRGPRAIRLSVRRAGRTEVERGVESNHAESPREVRALTNWLRAVEGLLQAARSRFVCREAARPVIELRSRSGTRARLYAEPPGSRPFQPTGSTSYETVGLDARSGTIEPKPGVAGSRMASVHTREAPGSRPAVPVKSQAPSSLLQR